MYRGTAAGKGTVQVMLTLSNNQAGRYPHKYAVKKPGVFEYLSFRDDESGTTVWSRIGSAMIFKTKAEAEEVVRKLAEVHIPAVVQPVASWRN